MVPGISAILNNIFFHLDAGIKKLTIPMDNHEVNTECIGRVSAVMFPPVNVLFTLIFSIRPSLLLFLDRS